MVAAQYKLLIADDDDSLREVIRDVCAPYFDVLEARSGDEAIDLGFSHPPDLVLCDMHMPGKTGLDVLQALKTLEMPRPGILMTARCSPELRDQALRLGVESLIEKPFSRGQLLRTFAKVVEAAFHDFVFRRHILPG